MNRIQRILARLIVVLLMFTIGMSFLLAALDLSQQPARLIPVIIIGVAVLYGLFSITREVWKR